MEEAVASVLERNDCLFTREEFRRQVAQEARARKQHQLASAANGEKAHEEGWLFYHYLGIFMVPSSLY